MISYGRQCISQSDIDEVIKILKSELITQGPSVVNFENAISEFSRANYCCAVNSATSALHIACLALGLGKDDYLWTSPNTFVASANCALYCQAKIDFVDIDPKYYTMCPNRLEDKLKIAKKNNLLPKIVVPVHYAGQPCDMEAIHALSKEYGFNLIEDASHAIGAYYLPKDDNSDEIKIGSCKHSDITVFSYHPVKIITTGEGGSATTNNPLLARKMEILRSHGIIRLDAEKNIKNDDEIWNYEQVELGFNYRLTDFQAALGQSQLKRIDKFLRKRNQIAEYYDHNLKDLPIKIPLQRKGTSSSYHLYPIRINKSSPKNRKYVYKFLLENGIGVNLHYIPVHRHPFFEKMGFKIGDFPESENFFREVISLPIHPGLEDSDLKKIISLLRTCLNG